MRVVSSEAGVPEHMLYMVLADFFCFLFVIHLDLSNPRDISQQWRIRKPETAQPSAAPDSFKRLVVEVMPGGAFRASGGQVMSLEGLRERIGQERVVKVLLRPHPNVPFRVMQPALKMLAETGVAISLEGL